MPVTRLDAGATIANITARVAWWRKRLSTLMLRGAVTDRHTGGGEGVRRVRELRTALDATAQSLTHVAETGGSSQAGSRAEVEDAWRRAEVALRKLVD